LVSKSVVCTFIKSHRSSSRLITLAGVQHPITGPAADAVADAGSVLVPSSRLALEVAGRHDERSEPADERSAAQCVEVSGETRGAQRYRVHWTWTWQQQQNDEQAAACTHSAQAHYSVTDTALYLLTSSTRHRFQERRDKRLKKLKTRIAFDGIPMTQLRDVTCHIGSRSVTCYPTQVNAPHPNPSQQVGTRFIPKG